VLGIPRASADDSSPTPVSGFVRELRSIDVTFVDGSASVLDVLITRPAQNARAPLVLVSHGNPPNPAERANASPTAFAALSMAFARHGYGVAVVMRRGYGRSNGVFVDRSGPCASKEYVQSTRDIADEILAALRRLTQESWVDSSKVVLLGHSAGGLATVEAGSRNPPGVVAAISFAGGRGSDGAEHVCRPDRLVAAYETFGKSARTPNLWIFSRNDRYFAPALATQMRDAYVSRGAPVELVIAPPFGTDGHGLALSTTPGVWWPHVEPFLRRVGLPTDLVHPALRPALLAPPTLQGAGRRAFEDYLASDGFEKAFAVGGVHWGWTAGRRSRTEAAQAAVQECRRRVATCSLYAIGNEYFR
jgi:dienelactone hydrolase